MMHYYRLTIIILALFLQIVTITKSSINNYIYDETSARFAFDFAAAAYSPSPLLCIEKHSDARLVDAYTVVCDAMRNRCQAFIAITNDTIIVSISGTLRKAQLLVELLETMTEPKRAFPSGGAVEHYFYQATMAIWSQMNTTLSRLIIDNPRHRLLFTGHSLGAALASLIGTYVAVNQSVARDRITLITFGQPRVGNQAFAIVHDRSMSISWRVTHRFDIVPHIPACFEHPLHTHSCIPAANHSAYHHGIEVWYPNEMLIDSVYRICNGLPINEDDNCSNAYYRQFNVDDHLYYFNLHVSEYGQRGCDNGIVRSMLRWLLSKLDAH